MQTPAGTIELQQLGKALGMGSKKIFAVLRKRHILDGDNTPFQSYLRKNYFKVVVGQYQRKNGDMQPYARTFATCKGVRQMKKILKEEGTKQPGPVGQVRQVGRVKKTERQAARAKPVRREVEPVFSGPDLVLGF